MSTSPFPFPRLGLAHSAWHLVGTALSGFSAASLSFTGHFALCAGLTLAAVMLVVWTPLPGGDKDPGTLPSA